MTSTRGLKASEGQEAQTNWQSKTTAGKPVAHDRIAPILPSPPRLDNESSCACSLYRMRAACTRQQGQGRTPAGIPTLGDVGTGGTSWSGSPAALFAGALPAVSAHGCLGLSRRACSVM